MAYVRCLYGEVLDGVWGREGGTVGLTHLVPVMLVGGGVRWGVRERGW